MEQQSDKGWLASSEIVSVDGGRAVSVAGKNPSMKDALLSGSVCWQRADGQWVILAGRPDFSQGWKGDQTSVQMWSGTPAELVDEALMMEGNVLSLGRVHEPAADCKVFERGFDGNVRTASWTLKGGQAMKNGRPASDQEVIQGLGWLARRMSKFKTHEYAYRDTDKIEEVLPDIEAMIARHHEQAAELAGQQKAVVGREER